MGFTKFRLAAMIAAVVILVPSLAVAVSPFVDVPTGAFYEAPVNWALGNGITTGSPKGSDTFKPTDPVTRGESVTFLKRYDDNVVQPGDTALGTRIDGLGQTVGTLTCDTSQVARFDGTNWVCNTIGLTTQLGVDATTPIDTGGDVGYFTSITVGTDNLPIISYYDATNFDLKVAHCTNTACTTSTNTAIDTGGDVGSYTSITVGADGLPIVSYRDNTNGDLKVARCTNTGCTTSTSTPVDTGGTNDVGFYTSIAIGTDGFPIISYSDATSFDLKVAHCANTACTTSTSTPVDTGGTAIVGSYTSIAIGTDNLPIVSYYDATNGDLKVAHCTKADCTTSTTKSIDTTGDVGAFTSIAVGADGFPVISYYDITNSDLKVAHCTNTACTTSTNTAIDNGGSYSSIAVGADGFPVISYYDITNSDLKVAHCTNASCTASFSAALDTTGDVGRYASLAVGTDTAPIVGYRDTSNADLKVAHVTMTVTGIAFG